jgi:hypothetical protein
LNSILGFNNDDIIGFIAEKLQKGPGYHFAGFLQVLFRQKKLTERAALVCDAIGEKVGVDECNVLLPGQDP